MLLIAGMVLSLVLVNGQSYSAIEKEDPRFAVAKQYSSDTIYKKVGSLTIDASWFREGDFLYYHIKEGGKKHYRLIDAKKARSWNCFQLMTLCLAILLVSKRKARSSWFAG